MLSCAKNLVHVVLGLSQHLIKKIPDHPPRSRYGVTGVRDDGIGASVFGFRCLLFVSLISILWSPTYASARPMITDLSERKIDIDAKFTGKEILLYGARVEAGDIVIVVRGPNDEYIVRKKEDIGGMWINTKSVEFKNVPQFYLIATSRELAELDIDVLKKNLNIGIDTFDVSAKPSSASVEINSFQTALFDKLENDKLLYSEYVNLPFLEGTLFRIRIPFPDKIIPGIYTAEIYSFNDGELRGIQSIPINIDKVGAEALIYKTAHDSPAVYGLLAILIALIFGWGAGSLFRKV